MEKETKIYRNSKKTKKLLLTSIGICIILLIAIIYSAGIFDGELKTKPLVFSSAAFLIMLILLLKTLLSLKDKSPLIELNNQNFYGKTTPLSKSFGIVNWEDVADIQLQKSGGDTLVVVTLNNPEKYEGRLSKMLWNMAYNNTTNQLMLMYSSSEIDIDHNALFDLFSNFWKKSTDSKA
ncbi:STM3941 family protein [Sphingobacterium faecium]|uniref:STM3941 family protein n=1 Tax=Sphingobacterium faecium TaxID=34087 RepID=UPI0024688362|nr:STM3941 family protein [Sphingobacterium faecium]MDH5825593.1 STM3941 family protein [Sphingobacterium faecium]